MLLDPPLLQEAATVGYVAAPVPSLSLLVLADSDRGGGLLFAPGRDEVAARCAACSPDTGTVARRARRSDVCLCGLPGEEKEEEEEEEKDSKTSSSCGRAHRRQRQLYVLGWFFWFCSSRCVRSFCRHAQDARHLGVVNQKDSYQWPVHGWCCWLWCFRAVFPFYCRQALLDKLFSPVVVQRRVPDLVRTVCCVARGESTGAVLGQGYGHYDRFHGPDSAHRLEVLQLQVIFFVVDFPVLAQRQLHMILVRFPVAVRLVDVPV